MAILTSETSLAIVAENESTLTKFREIQPARLKQVSAGQQVRLYRRNGLIERVRKSSSRPDYWKLTPEAERYLDLLDSHFSNDVTTEVLKIFGTYHEQLLTLPRDESFASREVGLHTRTLSRLRSNDLIEGDGFKSNEPTQWTLTPLCEKLLKAIEV